MGAVVAVAAIGQQIIIQSSLHYLCCSGKVQQQNITLLPSGNIFISKVLTITQTQEVDSTNILLDTKTNRVLSMQMYISIQCLSTKLLLIQNPIIKSFACHKKEGLFLFTRLVVDYCLMYVD